MHTVEQCFHLDSQIINLEALENKYVAISSKSGEVRINSCLNYENKLIITSEMLTSDVTAMSFSPNVTLLAFAVKSSIFVIDTRFDELLNEIPIDANEVDILTFDPSSHYLIVGTKFGRVFQYKYDNPSVLSRICSFPYDRTNLPKEFTNYVSAITFYESKIACSGYGGAIFVMDMHINTYREVIETSSYRVNSLCFRDIDNLIIANENGDIYFVSLNTEIKFKKIETKFENIKEIIKIPHTNYVFITSDKKSLAIVDCIKMEVLNDCYASFHDDIEHITLLDEKTIVVALKNGDILKLNLPTPEQLDEISKQYPLANVFKITQNATIVKNFKNYQKLEKQYNNIYKLATKALIDGDKKLAIKLLNKFTPIKSKQVGIKELFETFKHYDRFKSFINFKKYPEAYHFCEKYPMLMQTNEYKIMESEWKNNFLKAQQELMAGNLSNAKKLLSLYKRVASKKELCSFIYIHYKDFIIFLKALSKKDFKVIDELILKYQELEHIPTYINLNKRIIGSVKLVDNCIMKSNLELAKIHMAKLKNIPHIKKELNELEVKAYNVSLLQQLYERKDLLGCYQLLDTKKYLHHIALGRALEKHWAKLVSEAEELALEGNVKHVKHKLKSVINIESRKSKIGDLLRVAYHTKIKKLIDLKNFKTALQNIDAYLKIFGIDYEIEDIIIIYEDKSQTTLPYKNRGYKSGIRDNWRIAIDDI